MHPIRPIFDANGYRFETMNDEDRVPHLKIDLCGYFYQRRAPQ